MLSLTVFLYYFYSLVEILEAKINVKMSKLILVELF